MKISANSNKASSNKPRLVSIERAVQLINCYGADTQAWPEDERVAATSLIQASFELQQKLHAARQLDDALNDSAYNEHNQTTTNNAALTTRIIDQLPDQSPVSLESNSTLSTTSSTTSHNNDSFIWKKAGMIAAGFMLLLVSFVVTQSPPEALSPDSTLAQAELDQWLWDDISNNDINNDININTETEEDEELNFMAMIDLEI